MRSLFDQILTRLRALEAQGSELLMASQEVKASLARIDAATNNIAADIQRLKDGVKPGMTEQEVAEVQQEADRIAARLEGIAADPDNPDPQAETGTTTDTTGGSGTSDSTDATASRRRR